MRRLRTLALLALVSLPALAQSDPFYARVRGLTERPFPSYQGFACATIPAERSLVFRLLAAPDRAAQILLAGLPNVLPVSARYNGARAAAKGGVLILRADTIAGARRIEMTVVAVVPGRVLSFAVTKDDQVLAKDVAELTDTFVLESNPDGTTDVYWANHYDPSSPFAAAVGNLTSRRYRTRREIGLLTLEGLARAAASVPGGPPLPE